MTGDVPRRATAVWGLVLCTLFWGATFYMMKDGSEKIAAELGPANAAWAPLLFLAMRFTIAAVAFPFVFPRLRKGAKDSIKWGVLAGIPFSVGFMLQIYGLRDVSPTVSALFTSMFVVFTPLLGFLLFRKPPSVAVGIAIVFAVAGLWLVTGAGRLPHLGRGEWMSLLCALVFSFQIHATDVGTKRCDPIGLAWHQVTFGALACAAPIAVACPEAFKAIPASLAHREVWLGVSFTAILATVGSMALMSHFQRFLSPNHAAVVYTLEPVFAGMFSFVFFHEEFGPAKLLGGALVVAGNLACGLKGEVTEKEAL